MKDEIKEILDNLNKEYESIKDYASYPDDVLSCEDLLKLYDYITNLQEENVNLKTKLRWKERRNEKAIEYIKKVIEENEEWTMYREDTLLNILQGDDKK